jgi:hypothetical protein
LGRAVGLWAGLLLGLLPGARVASASVDLMVPAGVVMLDAELSVQQQDQGISTHGTAGGLREWALRSERERREVSGDLTRSVTWLTMAARYGLSDTWNLRLELPYGQLSQTADLTVNTADAELAARAATLETETLSGLGDILISSLHRPLYSDWNSLVVGLHLSLPGSGQDNPYIGRATLALAQPLPALAASLHYTHFPEASRSRWDLVGAWKRYGRGTVDTPLVDDRSLTLPDESAFSLHWAQELRTVTFGFGVRHELSINTVLDGENLNDDALAWIVQAEIGGGNLAALEEHPLALPQAWRVAIEQTVAGFNVPLGTVYALRYRLYF